MAINVLLPYLLAFGILGSIELLLWHHINATTPKKLVITLDATAVIVFLSGFVKMELMETAQELRDKILLHDLNYTAMFFLVLVLVVSVLLYKVT